MLTPQELKKSPLFQDIGYENYQQMLDCFQAVQRSYRVDEVIYDFSGPAGNAVGVVERGEASLIRIDEEGVATVLEELGPGGVFGKSLAFSTSGRDSLEVVCRTACDVVFIDYPHILKRCERACTHHSLLVQNMLRLISDKAQALSERVDVLSRRSIREAPVLLQPAGGEGGEPDLPAALLPEYAGGLHRHGPQRHDAGAEAIEGGGRPPVRGAAHHPLYRMIDRPEGALESLLFFSQNPRKNGLTAFGGCVKV